MPVTMKNLTSTIRQDLMKNMIIVQSPSIAIAGIFANVYLFRKFKATKLVATVAIKSTTTTTFSVYLNSASITVNIPANQIISNIWTGKIISPPGTVAFYIDIAGNGSGLTICLEGEYL